MTEAVPPEYLRFVAGERRAQRIPPIDSALLDGDTLEPIKLDAKTASALLTVAAKRAVGLYRPTKRTEVVWVNGSSELAVSLDGVRTDLADGLLRVILPVRCDQSGPADVTVMFAVGSSERAAGLYAATHPRPSGPAVVVETWGEPLVAFAWQCVLGLIAGIAGAVGKDQRGNVLVPADLIAADGELHILPMARHRFSGSTGLTSPVRR